MQNWKLRGTLFSHPLSLLSLPDFWDYYLLCLISLIYYLKNPTCIHASWPSPTLSSPTVLLFIQSPIVISYLLLHFRIFTSTSAHTLESVSCLRGTLTFLPFHPQGHYFWPTDFSLSLSISLKCQHCWHFFPLRCSLLPGSFPSPGLWLPCLLPGSSLSWPCCSEMMSFLPLHNSSILETSTAASTDAYAVPCSRSTISQGPFGYL